MEEDPSGGLCPTSPPTPSLRPATHSQGLGEQRRHSSCSWWCSQHSSRGRQDEPGGIGQLRSGAALHRRPAKRRRRRRRRISTARRSKRCRRRRRRRCTSPHRRLGLECEQGPRINNNRSSISRSTRQQQRHRRRRLSQPRPQQLPGLQQLRRPREGALPDGHRPVAALRRVSQLHEEARQAPTGGGRRRRRRRRAGEGGYRCWRRLLSSVHTDQRRNSRRTGW